SPTEAEIAIARGEKPLDEALDAVYTKALAEYSSTIKQAFEQQRARAEEPWDQEKFEALLVEWIVACDQPFDEVEKPEFIAMITYAHHRGGLRIPGRHGIRDRVMKLGEKIFDETREMFKDLDSKISLSIDAWTSSNGHAFLAIVAHWVSNEGQLEELLIDFCPLVGEHSGENMAAVVWETMEKYGITGKIMAVMMDNASNNDTLMQELELRCFGTGIQFSAKDARMRCMPHIIHLAALKLLEGIGAISSKDTKNVAYQDEVSVPVDRKFDNHAVLVDMDEEEDTSDSLENALSAIVRLRKISPQRREAWIKEVKNTLGDEQDDDSPALMLILDVKTRWSSTHQML
ncbi:hypothetical protein MPER_08973, partial [Moniliophthora perniciosa FA553]